MSEGGYLLNSNHGKWDRTKNISLDVWNGVEKSAQDNPSAPCQDNLALNKDGRKHVYGGEGHRWTGRSGFNLKHMRCFWQMEIQI